MITWLQLLCILVIVLIFAVCLFALAIGTELATLNKTIERLKIIEFRIEDKKEKTE